MKEIVEIQFKNRLLINRIGILILLLLVIVITIYFYTAWFEKWDFEQNTLFIIVMLLIFLFSLSFTAYRSFERATLSFISEGIIIKAKIGYIPIKFENVLYFKNNGLKKDDGKVEFVIETKDSRKFRIKSTDEVYEGLIKVFPDKNGKYTE